MTKLPFLLLSLLLASCSTGRDHHGAGPGMRGAPMMSMKAMDTNTDSLISKDEFMKFHEAMFERMKNKDGVIAMKDMARHPGHRGHRPHGAAKPEAMPGMCPMMGSGHKMPSGSGPAGAPMCPHMSRGQGATAPQPMEKPVR